MSINLDTAVATFGARPTVNGENIALQSDIPTGGGASFETLLDFTGTFKGTNTANSKTGLQDVTISLGSTYSDTYRTLSTLNPKIILLTVNLNGAVYNVVCTRVGEGIIGTLNYSSGIVGGIKIATAMDFSTGALLYNMTLTYSVSSVYNPQLNALKIEYML
jgi:hypothetical protein